MAKSKDGSMSQAIRDVLTANPKLSATEIISTLAAKGIKVKPGLVYFIKGKLKGGKSRRRKATQKAQAAAAVSVNHDPVATILKVKKLAGELGGLKKLKALVEALSPWS